MIPEMITSEQKKQLLRFFKKGLSKFLRTLRDRNLVQNDFVKSLQKHSIVDKRFGKDLLQGKGTFTVPPDYNHDTQVDTFGVKTRKFKSTYHYNDRLISENFAKTTNKFVPGKTYAIKMFPILEKVRSKVCLNRLKAEPGNVLVGAQGITLLREYQPDLFPVGKELVSLDEKKTLLKDTNGNHRVPLVNRHSGGICQFHFGNFESCWIPGNVLLCFCELDESSDA